MKRRQQTYWQALMILTLFVAAACDRDDESAAEATSGEAAPAAEEQEAEQEPAELGPVSEEVLLRLFPEELDGWTRTSLNSSIEEGDEDRVREEITIVAAYDTDEDVSMRTADVNVLCSPGYEAPIARIMEHPVGHVVESDRIEMRQEWIELNGFRGIMSESKGGGRNRGEVMLYLDRNCRLQVEVQAGEGTHERARALAALLPLDEFAGARQ